MRDDAKARLRDRLAHIEADMAKSDPRFISKEVREVVEIGRDILAMMDTPEPERVDKDDEGRPYPCGAFVSDDSRWFCRLESDHAGDHEWVQRTPEPEQGEPVMYMRRNTLDEVRESLREGDSGLITDHMWLNPDDEDIAVRDIVPLYARPQQSDEVARMRKALEDIFPADDGFTEAFDDLVRHGLLVEVPSDDAYRDQWGDEDTMYVWAWSSLARKGETG